MSVFSQADFEILKLILETFWVTPPTCNHAQIIRHIIKIDHAEAQFTSEVNSFAVFYILLHIAIHVRVFYSAKVERQEKQH